MTQLSCKSAICSRWVFVLGALLLLAASSFAQITEDSVVTLTLARPPITGPSPATQSLIVSPPPGGVAATTKVLIMLPGDNGEVQLTPLASPPAPANDGTVDLEDAHFVVRTRWYFASQGFLVITLDAASDFQLLPSGLKGQQSNPNHITDVLQVIAYARAISGLPANTEVWLVGGGRGTVGAWIAGGSYAPPAGPDGLVFVSPVNDSGDPDSLLSAPLGSIKVPTLLFGNKASTCPSSLASGDAAVLKALTSLSTTTAPLKASQTVNDAGFPALSTNCLGLSPHGYFGVEPTVVSKISSWITAN